MATRVRITQKNLKQPDQFISTTDLFLAYSSKHKNSLVGGVVAIVLLILAGFGYSYNQQVNTLRYETQYFEVHKVKRNKDLKLSEAISQMEALLNNFGEGPQKKRALLLLADAYYENGQFDKAINLYLEIDANTPQGNLVHQLARVGLAYSYEGNRDYAKAIEVYKSQTENGEGYPLFHVYLGLARSHELNNDLNGSLLVLREMKSKFPTHPEIDRVDKQIKLLSTKT